MNSTTHRLLLFAASVLLLAGCDDGVDGATGAAGLPGATGFSCWDLNENGIDADVAVDGSNTINLDAADYDAQAGRPWSAGSFVS